MILSHDAKHIGALMVILERGEKIMASLTQVAENYALKGGQIIGIGALKDVELGYYDLAQKTYHRQCFNNEDFELITINGNITLRDNASFIHAHAVLGKNDFSVFGGHLFEGIVAVTAEITIFPLGKMPCRAMNAAIGIPLICKF